MVGLACILQEHPGFFVAACARFYTRISGESKMLNLVVNQLLLKVSDNENLPALSNLTLTPSMFVGGREKDNCERKKSEFCLIGA
jgi:hypothetical protein